MHICTIHQLYPVFGAGGSCLSLQALWFSKIICFLCFSYSFIIHFSILCVLILQSFKVDSVLEVWAYCLCVFMYVCVSCMYVYPMCLYMSCLVCINIWRQKAQAELNGLQLKLRRTETNTSSYANPVLPHPTVLWASGYHRWFIPALVVDLLLFKKLKPARGSLSNEIQDNLWKGF